MNTAHRWMNNVWYWIHFQHILGHRDDDDDGDDNKKVYQIKDRNEKIKIKDLNERARPKD